MLDFNSSLLNLNSSIGDIIDKTATNMTMKKNVSVDKPPCFWLSEKTDNEKLYESIDYVITGPLLAVVIIVGMMCNVFCLVVFGRRFKRIRIYFYLLVLAAWDFSLLFGSFFMFALPTLLYGEIVLYGEYSAAFPFFYFLSNVARNGSVWIIVVLAFERYFALCHPYKFSVWNTEKRVYTLLAVVSVLAFVWGLPRFFELQSSECKHPLSDEVLPTLRATEMRKNTIYWFVYRVAGGFVFYSIGPFILLTALTIRISLEIGRSVRSIAQSRKLGRRQSQWQTFLKRFDYGATDDDDVMCGGGGENGGDKQNVNHWLHVAVITKFLIFHCTPTVCDIVSLIDPMFMRTQQGTLIGHVSNLLIVLNCSCNFFIYLRTSEHFKRDFADCVCRRPPPKAVSFL